MAGPPRLALVGVTATGKTELAIEIAHRLGDVEIVSADSMCVYRGMDLGTAKPSAADQAAVPHHLIDVADPSEEWSVVRHQQLARRAVAEIEQRGRRPLLVGGTGLYVQAIVDELAIPGRYPSVRDELERESTGDLYDRLRHLDPEATDRIEPGNRRRVLRALEVTVGSGRPFSSFGPGVAEFGPSVWSLAGIRLPRSRVDRRIEDRYRAQMAAGLLEEVAALARGRLSRTAAQALGYRELLDHLRGDTGLDEALEGAIGRTRRFAHRQERWFRRDPRITWISHDGNPLAATEPLLRHWSQ